MPISPFKLILAASLVGTLTGGSLLAETTNPVPRNAPQDDLGRFAAAILGNTEDVWKQIMPAQMNREYRPPKMVIFSGGTRSGCGAVQSATGPFYCPLDRTIYVDLSFFQDMRTRLRAGGDFAYAYVIAREVGHHVENELGILPRVQQRQQELGEVERNELPVRVELMADCLAGVWAHYSDRRYRSLEGGNVEEALRAAEAVNIGRDQTHGSSGQRMRWFMQGLRDGTLQGCDTFRANRL